MSVESDIRQMKKLVALERGSEHVTVVLVEPTSERPAGHRLERETPTGRVIEIADGGQQIEYPSGPFKLFSGVNADDLV